MFGQFINRYDFNLFKTLSLVSPIRFFPSIPLNDNNYIEKLNDTDVYTFEIT